MIDIQIVKKSEEKIYVDGKVYGIGEIAKKCRVGISEIKAALRNENPTKKINDWLYKTEAGVSVSCKTVWFEDCPMWTEIVVEETGVCISTARIRIREWAEDGDYDKLFRRCNTWCKPMGPKIGTKYNTKAMKLAVKLKAENEAKVKTKPKSKNPTVKRVRKVELAGRAKANKIKIGSWEQENL